MKWELAWNDPFTLYLDPYAALIGDRRTWTTFTETVKGIIASGSLVCQRIAVHSPVLGAVKKGAQRIIRMVRGSTTKRSPDDVWVSGSRQFREFDDYLIPPVVWATQKQTEEWPLAVPKSFNEYLDQQRAALHEQLTTVNDQLTAETLPNVTLRNGKLCLTRLEKAVPDDIEEFTRRVYAYVPFIKLTDLMIEVDASTRFSRHATHLHSGAAPKDTTA